MKGLAIVAALFVGGASLAMAQSGQPTGSYPPVAGGAAGNPATNPVTPGPPGPGVIPGGPTQSAAQVPSRTRIARHTTMHPKKMYMSARSHKGSKLNTTK
jgi:hypothetical protein